MRDAGIVAEAEVGCTDKSPTARILARVLKLRGVSVGDLRLFVQKGGGERVPTRAGISLPRERLCELRELVDRLIEAGRGAVCQSKTSG
jgi:hypothetical protein